MEMFMTRSFPGLVIAAMLAAFGSTSAAEPAGSAKPEPAKAALLAAETSAWATARPTFTQYCAACHTKAGKKATNKRLDHFQFDLDTYPPGGHHAATIGVTIRKVLGITGKKPTMPFGQPGVVQGDELGAIKRWTDAWEAAERAGAHPPAEAHHH
jgi:mono/diheme cytochrome c family protein